MNKFMLALAAAAFTLTTQATEHAQPAAQQSKMTTCNKDAGDKKGDDRKAFMKECLSAKGAAASASASETKSEARTPQQNKMKTCNKEAADKKGAERKAFMKECLSKKKA
jgi:hypothetical protein